MDNAFIELVKTAKPIPTWFERGESANSKLKLSTQEFQPRRMAVNGKPYPSSWVEVVSAHLPLIIQQANSETSTIKLS